MTTFLLIVLIGSVIWLAVRTDRLAEKLTEAERRLWELEYGQTLSKPQTRPEPTTPPPLPASLDRPTWRAAPPEPRGAAGPADRAEIPPLIPSTPTRSMAEVKAAATGVRPPTSPAPPLAEKPPLNLPQPPARKWWESANLEQFLGVKLFAWIGGLVLFLGAAFFLKHAFEQGWVRPEIRVAMGYVFGLGLIGGGLRLSRERSPVTVQTLCATGTVILYANIFASHAFYHLIGTTGAFALMMLVTVAAFVLAVRLEAQVVAVLGLLGGFLTPPLLSTGVDQPVALFGYLALLDTGLLAVALRKRWDYLILLGAAATALMQAAWVAEFFAVEKLYTALGIFLGFAILFIGAFGVAHRIGRGTKWTDATALLMPAAGLVFVLHLLSRPYPTLAAQPGWLFGFVFLMDLGFLVAAWLRADLRPALTGGGAGVFLLLTLWTMRFLTADLLYPALAFYLLFAVAHSVIPVVLQRLRPATTPLGWIHLWPPLTLLLMLVPILKLAEPSFLIWPVVLLVDLLAIALAILTASLVMILTVFALTMLATALWLIKMPPLLSEVPESLVVIGGFSVFFAAAAIFSARRVSADADGAAATATAWVGGPCGIPVLAPSQFAQISSIGAVLPFLLLSLMVLRLPLENPAPVFGVALLLVVLLLGAGLFFSVDLLAVTSLGAVLLLEYAWHLRHFGPAQFEMATGWHVAFGAVFLVSPFLFPQRFVRRVVPWAVSALALPLHFFLIHRALVLAHPAFEYKGLVPALLGVPCLAALLRLVRILPAEGGQRQTLLAWFGGATLFFLTFVFPIQFEREWLTIGWALEGVALVWLFHRVPHAGLRLVGVALLAVAFVRLALNPAVLEYHARSATPIFNWFLYAYGLGAICMMAGARLLARPRHRIGELNVPPVLYGLGTVLAFLLLNLEIADYFSTGSHLTFEFSGNFAQDMTYSLAWGLFAFCLLAVGFRLESPPTRYAGMGLLGLTILKLFLHDLFRLGGLYRVGSLVGLAVLLIVVSFIYQRFLSGAARRKEPAEK